MIKLKSLRKVLIPYDYVLVKKRYLGIETHTQEECHVKMKAENGEMYTQAKGCYRLPGNHQK